MFVALRIRLRAEGHSLISPSVAKTETIALQIEPNQTEPRIHRPSVTPSLPFPNELPRLDSGISLVHAHFFNNDRGVKVTVSGLINEHIVTLMHVKRNMASRLCSA